MIWTSPVPRFAWAADYPWGRNDEDMRSELRDIEMWGTAEYGRRFLQDQTDHGNDFDFDAGVAEFTAKASRNACTPDVARALAQIWYETDARGVLSSIQAPTLLLEKSDHREDLRKADYVASLIPGSEVRQVPGGPWGRSDMLWIAEQLRAFAGLARAPVELDRVLSTVLFTDIVGSTEKAAALGDGPWRELLAEHDRRARSEIERFRGTYVDSTGDGLLARFDGPARAVRCAQGIGALVHPLGLEIRAGCHTGEIELDGAQVRGIAVHIGARVAALAGPKEVLVSSTVKDLTAGSGLRFEDAGNHELKGVPDLWHLFRVLNEAPIITTSAPDPS